ncbi:MAG: EAL domain-containing protein [Clostridia bacterium]|nr:EAL domain-containing protein [Clostridia bacterium]
MIRQITFADYSPIGDLTSVSICVVMACLIYFSYINKTRSFRVFLSLIGLIAAAAITNVITYTVAVSGGKIELSNGLRCVYHGLLYMTFLHFVIYIITVARVGGPEKGIYLAVALTLFAAVTAAETLITFREGGMIIAGDGTVTYQGRDIFLYGYLGYIILIVVMMARVRNRLFRRVMSGFYSVMAISFLMLAIQQVFGQISYTVATFLYPVIAMFYIMHSTPYDAMIGAIDSGALGSLVHYAYERKKDFVFMSLYLRQFHEEGKPFPEDFQATIRRFSTNFFRGAVMFQVGKGHEMLLIPVKRNPDYENRIRSILQAFDEEYEKYKYDYKIVIGESMPEISRKNEYVSFVKHILRRMPENSVHRVTQGDVERFNQDELLLKELTDIHEKHDLNDPRVLVYFQPVLNLKTRKYDTAEVLMRLKLSGGGMEYPDRFIPLAEENGIIHTLTEIILYKTCLEIKNLLASGYHFARMSVNVSVLELKDDGFCQDIIDIIGQCNVPQDTIAIELTESRSDDDFLLMKSKINELRQQGIKIYLDDFGTGYSNMERIMELPFDIIKFDRSLVLACGASERSEKLVEGLAGMFSDLQYSVLYEGVESEADEKKCSEMFASYLQGYKYSRPIPLDRLTEYFEK